MGTRASRTASRSGLGRILRDALARFLAADGTTLARALAYESAFIILSGYVGIVGLAGLLDADVLRGVVQELGRTISPGPAGRLLVEAAEQGAQGGATAAIVGLAAALSSGTLAMAQVERSANRLAGSNEDRPLARRYLVAFVLAVTVGVLFLLGALILGAGRALPSGLGWTDEFLRVWTFVRWPVGVAVVALAVSLLYRFAPRSRLGPRRAVVVGSAVAVVLWVTFTGLLSLYFAFKSSSPYGPFLSIVALLLWSMLSSLALHLGLATACTLAGARRPRKRTPS
jgi:YihY family inner membrane protein